MTLKKNLLFYGELPPQAVHGISYSNKINIDLLKKHFEVVIVEEVSSINNNKLLQFLKVFRLAGDFLQISKNALIKRFDFFYLTFSISFFGGLKTLFSIISFRLFNRGRVVVHIHRGDFYLWHDRNIFNRWLAKLVIGLSGKIIVLSDIYKVAFNRKFSKPVFVLHNTVEYESVVPINDEKSGNNFIFISNYIFEKGILDLLEVFSKLLTKYPDVTLHTFGAFPTKEMKERILKYSNRNIIVSEIISDKEKFAAIEMADCLILPSLNEGEPLVLLEAMSVGTPVISTTVGLIPELLEEDYPFLFIPGDQESLMDCIVRFIASANRSYLSRKLKERYNKVYSNKIHSEVLLSIFN